MGKPSIRQVELLEGREIIGKQSSWLVTLKGFDTPEKVITYCSLVCEFTRCFFLNVLYQSLAAISPLLPIISLLQSVNWIHLVKILDCCLAPH